MVAATPSATTAAVLCGVIATLAVIARLRRTSARQRHHLSWVQGVGFKSLHREMETAVRLAVQCGEAMLSMKSTSKRSAATLKDGKRGIDPQTAVDLANELRRDCSRLRRNCCCWGLPWSATKHMRKYSERWKLDSSNVQKNPTLT